ncbi:uncharacterized [Tachysurus ichikawai]
MLDFHQFKAQLVVLMTFLSAQDRHITRRLRLAPLCRSSTKPFISGPTRIRPICSEDGVSFIVLYCFFLTFAALVFLAGPSFKPSRDQTTPAASEAGLCQTELAARMLHNL